MSELEELQKEAKAAEKASKAARSGFDAALGNPSPAFDTAFKAFIGLALGGILLAFVQQLGVKFSVPPIPDGNGGGGRGAGCSISCGGGVRGATISASCGSCPSNTYKDSEYTSGGRRYLQCVCR